jgi:hypothetical protein
MKDACKKWKDQLLEAALTGGVSVELAEHLQTCVHCAEERNALEARRMHLEALLSQTVQSAGPSADFRARVLAAAEATGKHRRIARWQAWTLAAAGAATAAALVVMGWNRGSRREIPPEELAAAQKLAEWRAPSDSLLKTPGQEILKTIPKLGGSYLTVPMKTVEED